MTKDNWLDLIESLIVISLFLSIAGMYFEISNSREVFNKSFLLMMGYGIRHLRTYPESK